MDIKQYIKDELIKGTDKSDIIGVVARERGCSRDAARKVVANIRKNLQAQNQLLATPANTPANVPYNVMAQPITTPGTVVPLSYQLSPNGDKIFEDIVTCMNGKDVNPLDIMKAHHLNPAEWEVVALKSNLWQGMAKGGVQVPMYQSKLSVRPRKFGSFSPEDIKEYFDELKKSGQVPLINMPINLPSGDEDGVILELDAPDVHAGLLSWAEETCHDSDLKILYGLWMDANLDLYKQVKDMNLKVKQVKIVSLGDFLHVDNDEQTTTKGTFQQVDGRLPKIYKTAITMLRRCIELWATIAPVEYIYVRGNHDQVLGYAVANAMELLYEGNDHILVDASPNPHKYRKLTWDKPKKSKKAKKGESDSVMVVFTHGDMNKDNLEKLPYTLANAVGEDMTDVVMRYLHVGHLHNQNSYYTKDGGTEVWHLNSFCYHSYWEWMKGYGGTKSLFLNMWVWRKGATRPHLLTGDSFLKASRYVQIPKYIKPTK